MGIVAAPVNVETAGAGVDGLGVEGTGGAGGVVTAGGGGGGGTTLLGGGAGTSCHALVVV